MGLMMRPARQPARLAPQGERGGPRPRLLFALRREPAASTYGAIATAMESVPPVVEFTVMDGGKGEVTATGANV